jgi:hypothetical protein
MKEISGCCEGDYHVGPTPKKIQQNPDFVVLVTSTQYERNQAAETAKLKEQSDGE